MNEAIPCIPTRAPRLKLLLNGAWTIEPVRLMHEGDHDYVPAFAFKRKHRTIVVAAQELAMALSHTNVPADAQARLLPSAPLVLVTD